MLLFMSIFCFFISNLTRNGGNANYLTKNTIKLYYIIYMCILSSNFEKLIIIIIFIKILLLIIITYTTVFRYVVIDAIILQY